MDNNLNLYSMIYDIGCEHPDMYEINAKTMGRHLAYWHNDVSPYACAYGQPERPTMRKDNMRTLHAELHTQDDALKSPRRKELP